MIGRTGATGGRIPQIKEQLGLAPDARVLLVQADDAGLSGEVNRGILMAIGAGVVSSTSVMVPGPAFDGFGASLVDDRMVAIGVHITLTSAGARMRPIAPTREVPDLLDDDGFFVERWSAPPPIRQIAIEIAAQVERARAAGIAPAYADSHQFMLFRHGREVFDVFASVASDYDLPVVLGRGWQSRWPWLSPTNEARAIVLDEVVWAGAEVPVDRLACHYDALLDRMRPGLTLLVVHPAVGEPAEMLTDRPWALPWRQRDLAYVLDPALRGRAGSRGVHLAGWRQLGAAGRAR